MREYTKTMTIARYRRQPEIEHLHHALRCELDIRRLQVAVDDAFLVRRLERVGDLLRIVQRGIERQRAWSVSPSTSSITSARSSTP